MSEGGSVPASSAPSAPSGSASQPNISPLAKYKLVFLGTAIIITTIITI
jgi:hypothetical protein